MDDSQIEPLPSGARRRARAKTGCPDARFIWILHEDELRALRQIGFQQVREFAHKVEVRGR